MSRRRYFTPPQQQRLVSTNNNSKSNSTPLLSDRIASAIVATPSDNSNTSSCENESNNNINNANSNYDNAEIFQLKAQIAEQQKQIERLQIQLGQAQQSRRNGARQSSFDSIVAYHGSTSNHTNDNNRNNVKDPNHHHPLSSPSTNTEEELTDQEFTVSGVSRLSTVMSLSSGATDDDLTSSMQINKKNMMQSRDHPLLSSAISFFDTDDEDELSLEENENGKRNNNNNIASQPQDQLSPLPPRVTPKKKKADKNLVRYSLDGKSRYFQPNVTPNLEKSLVMTHRKSVKKELFVRGSSFNDTSLDKIAIKKQRSHRHARRVTMHDVAFSAINDMVNELPLQQLLESPLSASKPFDHFMLLSASLNQIEDSILKENNPCMNLGSRSRVAPIIFSNPVLIDSYHPRQKSSGGKRTDAIELSTFCFPNGLRIRILPRRLLQRAKDLGLVGSKADKFHLLRCTDDQGKISFGVGMTVVEEFHSFRTDIAASLLQLKATAYSAVIVQNWWRKCLQKRELLLTNSEDENKTTFQSLRKSMKKMRRMYNEKDEDKEDTSPNSGSGKFFDTSKGHRRIESNGKTSRFPYPFTFNKEQGDLGRKLNFGTHSFTKTKKHGDEYSDTDIEKSARSKVDASVNEEGHNKSITTVNVNDSSTHTLQNKSEHSSSSDNLPQDNTVVAVNENVIRLAKEAYSNMKKLEFEDYICFVEKCYCLVDVDLEKMVLPLAILQNIVNFERKEIQRKSNCPQGNLRRRRSFSDVYSALNFTKEKESIDKEVIDNRRIILAQAYKDSMLTEVISSFSLPSCDYLALVMKPKVLQIDLPLQCGSLNIPLPFQSVGLDWGLAKLLTRCGAQSLLNILHVMLMERSVLVLGSKYEDVCASVYALVDLLNPYKWEGTVVPLIPATALDLLSAPVPFIAGLADDNIGKIEADLRLKEAMQNGLSVINVTEGFIMVTSETGVADIIPVCKNENEKLSAIAHRLTSLQKITKNRSGVLSIGGDIDCPQNSFSHFISAGLTTEELIPLRSARRILCDYFCTLSRELHYEKNAWKNYGLVNKLTTEFEFYPAFFVGPRRVEQKFQETFAHTQMFVSFIDKRRKEDMKLEETLFTSHHARFIANFIYKRWIIKRRTRK